MKFGRLTLAALAGAALFVPSLAGAQPAIENGALPHGGSYLIAGDPSSPTTALDLWFRAPDSGYGTPVPGLAQVSATAAAAAKLESGRTLAESVQDAGGRLSISVFHDIIGISVVVPAADARPALASLTAAYFKPSIDAGAVHSAQSDATILAVQQQYEPDELVHDLLFAQLFEAGAAHDPPIPFSVSDISQITLDEVSAFAQRAFRAGNAFLTLSGDVDPTMLSAVTVGDIGVPDAPIAGTPARTVPAPLSQEGPEPSIGLAWIGPPIADERAATALDFIADYLFRPGTGTFARQLVQNGSDVGLNGQFITLHDPGVLVVTVEGSDDARLQEQIVDAISALEQPLSATDFAAAREAFIYHVNEDTQTAAEEADNLGWYAAEGAAAYAPGGELYDSTAASLDPEFVAATVRRYLTQPAVVRIVPAAAPKGSSS